MKRIAEFMMEACFLKHIPRSGYQYLGAGRESVAEHTYAASMIGFILAQMIPEANTEKLLTMCMLHDLPEARVGDLNYVQKQYVKADESKALSDALENLPFGQRISDLIEEFNACSTLESKLARDADQLALIIDLKYLEDRGHQSSTSWFPAVKKRLKTEIGIKLAETIIDETWDGWWKKIFC